MRHIKKLRAVGNSTALLLDKDTLEALQLDQGSLVTVSVSNGAITITKAANDATPTTRAERIEAVRKDSARIMRDFDSAFKKLAE